MSDLISRQAVLQRLTDIAYNYCKTEGQAQVIDWIKTLVCVMPSAQPEKLTDKEQRIFLSAMGREEEVCKEVDDAWRDSREPYEDSLVHVCKEIKRKVKGALWT